MISNRNLKACLQIEHLQLEGGQRVFVRKNHWVVRGKITIQATFLQQIRGRCDTAAGWKDNHHKPLLVPWWSARWKFDKVPVIFCYHLEGPSGQVASRQQQMPVQVYLAQFLRNHRCCQHLRAAQCVVAHKDITDTNSSTSKYIIIFSLTGFIWHKFFQSNMQHIDLHLFFGSTCSPKKEQAPISCSPFFWKDLYKPS